MEHFKSSTIGSTLICSLIAGVFLLGGCSGETVTGPNPEPDQKVRTQEKAPHNVQPNNDNGSTDEPGAGHNT